VKIIKIRCCYDFEQFRLYSRDCNSQSASGSLKAEPKECLTGKGQVLSKGLRAERIKQMANFDIIANKDCLKSTIVYARFI